MRGKTKKIVFGFAITLFAASFTAGCAHMEKSPPERQTGYALIHKPLGEASRKIDEARAAGKDKECPAEFKDASDTVDKAYTVYLSCHTQEGIALAQEGINKANALCPPKAAAAPGGPVAPPEAAPAPPPAVAPPPSLPPADVAHFAFDKANLSPAEQARIKAFREEARAQLDSADKIVVTGHTDSTGPAEYNMKLSERRAEAVRNYLDKLGVDRNKMEVHGAGETKPIADNSTKAGRAQNRRVEVEVIAPAK